MFKWFLGLPRRTRVLIGCVGIFVSAGALYLESYIDETNTRLKDTVYKNPRPAAASAPAAAAAPHAAQKQH